ncbi:hypothetical protein [Nocardiopsis sp. NRRL B-16309]|uniref:hypothetical protein n=1 Tax=Nocardiopsis sp. NRRL B-16309 TaxID=1519494 RepID=UPI0006ADC874|nr:hypothetical protein [Nocardiopsis sp. NRRL B-16309]KOX11836.1 hypothetical protein ADL05_23025 [Nocardiopsis sp. NRRL B-16309]
MSARLRLVDDQDLTHAQLGEGAEVQVTLPGKLLDTYEVSGVFHYVVEIDSRRIVIAPAIDGTTITRTDT